MHGKYQVLSLFFLGNVRLGIYSMNPG